jgi:hypothetical protein
VNQLRLLHFARRNAHLLGLVLDISHCHSLYRYACRCHILISKTWSEHTPFSSLFVLPTRLGPPCRAGVPRTFFRPISPSFLTTLPTKLARWTGRIRYGLARRLAQRQLHRRHDQPCRLGIPVTA